MPADARDDFSIFVGLEHMFFGLSDPYAVIREETERILDKQVQGTVIESILCHGEPQWLTLGREQPNDPKRVIVGHYAFCFRCQPSIRTPTAADVLDATLTFMFCERVRAIKPLHANASPGKAPRTWLP